MNNGYPVMMMNDPSKADLLMFEILQNYAHFFAIEVGNRKTKFYQQIWFWKEIIQHELMIFLNFARDETLARTAASLLYAFVYPGTMQGFIHLAKALFGEQSNIIITEPEPAVVTIEIHNTNAFFLFALASKNYTLAIEKRFALATNDFSAAVSYDPLAFFRSFLTPGRVIRSLDIKNVGSKSKSSFIPPSKKLSDSDSETSSESSENNSETDSDSETESKTHSKPLSETGSESSSKSQTEIDESDPSISTSEFEFATEDDSSPNPHLPTETGIPAQRITQTKTQSSLTPDFVTFFQHTASHPHSEPETPSLSSKKSSKWEYPKSERKSDSQHYASNNSKSQSAPQSAPHNEPESPSIFHTPSEPIIRIPPEKSKIRIQTQIPTLCIPHIQTRIRTPTHSPRGIHTPIPLRIAIRTFLCTTQ